MSKVWTWLGQRRKAIFAEVALGVTWLQVAYVPDGHISRAEWIALVTALLGGLGVHAVTNVPLESATTVVKNALQAWANTAPAATAVTTVDTRVPVPTIIEPVYETPNNVPVPSEAPPGE